MTAVAGPVARRRRCRPWVSTARPGRAGRGAAGGRGRSRSSTRRPRSPRSGRTSCCRTGWRPSSAGDCRSSRSRSGCCCWPASPPGRPPLATAVLLVVFIAAVASAAARGLSIDCGCFGGGGPVPPGQTAYGRRDRPGPRSAGCRPAGWSPGRRAGSAWSGRDEPSAEQARRPAPRAVDPAGGAGRAGGGGGRRRHRAPGLADRPRPAAGRGRRAHRRRRSTITTGQPIVFGAADAPVVVTLFADFHCPHCAEFEEEYGPVLDAARQAGRIRLEVYPMAFIDEGSAAAANAFGCAAEAGFGPATTPGCSATRSCAGATTSCSRCPRRSARRRRRPSRPA